MKNQKKLITIVIVIFLILIGGLFFGYQFFLKDTSSGIFNRGGDTGGNSVFPSGDGIFGGGIGENEKPDTSDTPIPELRQLSTNPTAGGAVFNGENKTIITYVERATGHIFETSKESFDQVRISQTTIPRIQESVWHPTDENEVILRYLDENELLRSFYGTISKEESTLSGFFLGNNITSLSVHNDGDLFFLQKNSGGVQGNISSFNGGDAEPVFSSEISEWRSQWGGDSLFLNTKASHGVEGFLFRVVNNTLRKVASGNGLVSLMNPDGTKALLSLSGNTETTLFVYDLADDTMQQVPFRTLVDKCSWSTETRFYCASPYGVSINNALFPDDWYNGLVQFSDDIWLFDTESNLEQLVYDAETSGVQFDATDLVVDREEQVLLFTNKDDLTLWALSL